jgi:hypothetical protein
LIANPAVPTKAKAEKAEKVLTLNFYTPYANYK